MRPAPLDPRPVCKGPLSMPRVRALLDRVGPDQAEALDPKIVRAWHLWTWAEALAIERRRPRGTPNEVLSAYIDVAITAYIGEVLRVSPPSLAPIPLRPRDRRPRRR
jgi:hypothetical protein